MKDKSSLFLKLLLLDDIFVIQNDFYNAQNLLENSLHMSRASDWFIDLINFKVFALLMCPGRPKDKANILFDMIYGP